MTKLPLMFRTVVRQLARACDSDNFQTLRTVLEDASGVRLLVPASPQTHGFATHGTAVQQLQMCLFTAECSFSSRFRRFSPFFTIFTIRNMF
ncbi:hypothetical protein HanIR_Chr04g0182741 [Helianthus annuus]|nr:hypothetical protein HanIR_Chr04g0182741 [Helianthus annuus]